MDLRSRKVYYLILILACNIEMAGTGTDSNDYCISLVPYKTCQSKYKHLLDKIIICVNTVI